MRSKFSFWEIALAQAPNKLGKNSLPTPHPPQAVPLPPLGKANMPPSKCEQGGLPQYPSFVGGSSGTSTPTNYLLFYANKEVSHKFLRSSAGGRLPPLQEPPFFGKFLCGRRENDMLYRFRWLSTADTRFFRAERRWKNHGVNESSAFFKKRAGCGEPPRSKRDKQSQVGAFAPALLVF